MPNHRKRLLIFLGICGAVLCGLYHFWFSSYWPTVERTFRFRQETGIGYIFHLLPGSYVDVISEMDSPTGERCFRLAAEQILVTNAVDVDGFFCELTIRVTPTVASKLEEDLAQGKYPMFVLCKYRPAYLEIKKWLDWKERPITQEEILSPSK